MSLMILSAAIIAGGQSTRMGGEDKALMLFRGEPMVLPIARALSDVAKHVFINTNRDYAAYLDLGFDVVKDLEISEGGGPLSGILTCLEHARSSESRYLIISPCDTPCITNQAFLSLVEVSKSCQSKIVYLEGVYGSHPLHAILPVASALRAIKDFLKLSDKRSVMAFYESFGCQAVLWSNDGELLNVNTPDALR